MSCEHRCSSSRNKKQADTFLQSVENLRPGAMDRLGLGYEDLAKVNKGIILASTSGMSSDVETSRKWYVDIHCRLWSWWSIRKASWI